MPDPNTETVFDAVDDALGLGGDNGTSTDGDAGESGGADENLDSSQAGDGTAAADGEGAAGAGEGESGDAGGEGKSQPAADADGKEGAGKGAERDPATGKFKKSGEPDGSQKQPDAINDPIPKDLKPQTQERIRTLIKDVKEQSEIASKATEDLNVIVQGLQASGTTPEQYSEVLSFMSLFNSRDAEQQGKALEILENMADRLAALLGKERMVGDPLSEHADLKEAVQKGHINAQYAREIARQRKQTSFRTEIATSVRQSEEQATAAANEKNQARTDLNTLETTLRATDPHYDAIRAQLVPILKPVFAAMPPSQWKAAFQQAYANAKAGFVPPKPTPKPVTGQPLRANKSPAGGGSRAASSAMDVVNAAIAAAGR